MAVEEHRSVVAVDYLFNYADRGAANQFERDVDRAAATIERFRRLAAGNFELPNFSQLALPAGTGTPRVDGRFVSRQRAVEAAQDQFFRALNERARAEQALAASAQRQLRAQRFQERVAAVADRPTAVGLSFGPGGNPLIQFALATRDTTTKFQALARELDQVRRDLATAKSSLPEPSKRRLDAFNRSHNEREIEAVVRRNLQSMLTDGDFLHGEALLQTLRNIRGVDSTQLFVHGRATSALLNALPPEQRQLLIGTTDTARALRVTSGPDGGYPVPQLNPRNKAYQLYQSETLGQLEEAERRAARALNQYAARLDQGRAEFPGLGRGGRQGRAYGTPFGYDAVDAERALVPHSQLFGQGLNQFPEFDRAVAALRARMQEAQAAILRGAQQLALPGVRSPYATPVQPMVPVYTSAQAAADRARYERYAALRRLTREREAANSSYNFGDSGENPRYFVGSSRAWRQPELMAGRPNPEAAQRVADGERLLGQVYERIAAQKVGDFSKEREAQAGVVTAEERLAAVTDRLVDTERLGFNKRRPGGGRTFQSQGDAEAAAAAAAKAASAANERLDKAIRDRVAAEEAAASSARRTANAQAGRGGVGGGGGGVPPFGGPFGPAGGGSRFGGFLSDFRAGFRGNPDTPIASQLGQTARFSVFYGTMYKLLFALTQTFSASLQEGIQFEDAMTNLVIASSKPREQLESLARELGQESVRAGFAPSQGVEIGARSLGLYGAANAPIDTQRQVATISARVVSQLAVGSKKSPVELQGDIAAIAQALGLGANGQQRIADLDAFFTKRFGVQQGSTLETVAQSASVGKAAGFSNEQIFAIAADMISRTGQTPSAVAGFMAQIFSRGGEGSLTSVAQKQGIDPNQPLAQIVGQLANIYRTADPRTQAQISASFGRGKVQNAAVALLSDYSEVNAASADSLRTDGRGAAGAANRQFEEHIKNIGGQLQVLSGQFKLFAQQLGQSGLLDAIGAGVFALSHLVDATNGVLAMFLELPRPIRDVIVGLVALAAAQKVGLLRPLGRAIGGRDALGYPAALGYGAPVTGLRAAFTAGRDASLLRSAESAYAARGLMQNGQFYSRASGFLVSPSSALREFTPGLGANLKAGVSGIARAGASVLGMIGPVGLAIGGLVAIGSIKSSMDRMKAAQDSALDALIGAQGLNPTTSGAEDYLAQAAELRAQADLNRNATGGFLNFITFGQADNQNQATAGQLEASAKRLDRIAANFQEAETAPQRTFSSLGAEDLKTGLDAITASGGTAQTQLTALRDALYGTAGAAQAAKDAFDPKTFAQGSSDNLLGSALGGLREGGVFGRSVTRAGRGGGFTDLTGNDLAGNLASLVNTGDVQKLLLSSLNNRGIDSLAGLNRETAGGVAGDIAGPIADQLVQSLGPGVQADAAKIRRAIQKALQERLLQFAAGTKEALSGTSALSAEDATALIGNIAATSDTYLGSLPETNTKGRVAELRQRIRDIRAAARRSDDPRVGAIAQQEISRARTLLVDTQIAEAERLRRAALQNGRNRADANRRAQGVLRRVIRQIVNNGNSDQLAGILESAGKGAIAIARQAIAEALAVARAGLKLMQDLDNFGDSLGAEGGPRGAGAAFRGRGVNRDNAENNATIQRLEELDRFARGSTYAGPDDDKYHVKGGGVYNPNISSTKGGSGAADRDTQAEIDAARAAALAGDNPVAAARAQIAEAQAAMDKAKENSVAYWQAVGQYHDGQRALAAALADQASARGAAAAGNNPVAQARNNMRTAREAMNRAAREEGRDSAAFYQAVQQFKEARLAYTQALSAVRVSQVQANAARVGGAIASANASIVSAREAIRAAAGDAAAQADALGQFYEGQRALREAMLAYQKNRMLLGVDMTNPAAVAGVDARAAALKLRQDQRAGQAKDVIAQDRVDLRNAQANAESTRFQQRLQSVQTAEQLGRISHAKYIQYLDNEARRLENVKHRSFQQQQQLDQIQGLLKDASKSMEAQFNFGDIKLPTPYQVRRYIESNTAGLSKAGSFQQNSQTNTIYIDGADTGKVMKIISDTLGKTARTVSATPRRR